MAEKIDYNDKVNIESKPIANENKITDTDINQIKSKYNGLVDELGIGGVDDNVRIISINTAGATNKIKSTLDLITDSSSVKQYLVQVRPGTYVEDNFIIPKFVTLVSTGGHLTTSIKANTITGTLITISEGCSLGGFNIDGKTDGTAVLFEEIGHVGISRNSIKDCEIGCHINNSSAIVHIENHEVETELSPIADGFILESGNITLDGIKVINNAVIGNLVRVTGDAVPTIRNIESFSQALSIGIKLEGASKSNVYSVSIVGANDGIVVTDGATGTFDNIKIFNPIQDGFRCEVGTGDVKDLTFSGSLISNGGRYDMNFICANVNAFGWASAVTANSYINPSANVVVQILDLFGGDEAFNLISELHVGSPTRPRESVFGEGDSHVNLLAYTSDDDITYTDITAAVKSNSGSSFTFKGVSSGNSIYLTNIIPDSSGNPLQFYGFKTIVETAAALGSGNFAIEHWNDITGWVDEGHYMETQSSGRYYSNANSIFENTGSFHIRGPVELSGESDPNLTWDINDPISSGINRYWVRIRIKNTITTAPIFQQFKLHSNRFEVNGDGWLEYFGSARPISKLPWEVQVFEKAAGTDVKDQDLYLSQTIDNGGKKNKFIAQETDPNRVQRIGFKTSLPLDMDTSSPVNFEWSVITDSVATPGTIDWIIRWGFTDDGDNIYTTSIASPVTSPNQQEIVYPSDPPSATNKLKWYRVSLDVSKMISRRGSGFGDIIWVSMERSSVDTHSGDVSLVAMAAYYAKWCEGGHI